MSVRHAFCAILCSSLVLGSCTPGKKESGAAESAKIAPQTAEKAKAHLGGCILMSPASEVPVDPYLEEFIAQ